MDRKSNKNGKQHYSFYRDMERTFQGGAVYVQDM